MKHGVNGHVYGSTFIEVRGEAQMAKDNAENMRRFAGKYGIENDTRKIMEFIEKASGAPSRAAAGAPEEK